MRMKSQSPLSRSTVTPKHIRRSGNVLYCEISHHKINTATGRKKSTVLQGSSRQRCNKRDSMSQMLLGLCIVSPVGNKCLPLRLSGKSLELLVPSSASVESSERALGVRSRPMGEDINSVCSSGDRTTSRRMHDRTHPPIEVSMLALGESAE